MSTKNKGKKRQNKSPVSGMRQSSIFQGIKNMKVVYERQQILKSKELVTTNSICVDLDSDFEDDRSKKPSAKRKLFDETREEKSSNHSSTDWSLINPVSKLETSSSNNDLPLISSINEPEACSTPVKTANLEKRESTPDDSNNDSDSTIIIDENMVIAELIELDSFNFKQNEHSPSKRNAFNLLRSPSKSQLSVSPFSSPEKMTSPQKRRASMRSYLRLVKNLFDTVLDSSCFKNLVENEREFAEIFTKRDDNNFKFCCLKLYLWKSKWYNFGKFCEKLRLDVDKHEIEELYHLLQRKGIVDTDYVKEDVSYLLNILDRNEVKEVYQKFKLKKNVISKEEMIKQMLCYCQNQSTLGFSTKTGKELMLKEICKLMEKCVRVSRTFQDAFFRIYFLATFTNSTYLDISQFFNNMMRQNVVYPEYKVEEYPVFNTREEFLEYCHARKLFLDFEEAFTSKNHSLCLEISNEAYCELKKLPDREPAHETVPHLKRYTAKSAYTYLLTTASEQLSAKFPEEVRKWLEYLISTALDSKRAFTWYNRLSWLYVKHTKPDGAEQAAKMLLEFLENNKNDETFEHHLHDLRVRVGQIKAKVKKDLGEMLEKCLPQDLDLEGFPEAVVDAQALRGNQSGTKRNYVVQDYFGTKTYTSVENIALQHYVNHCGYTSGTHCEGQLIMLMFTLLFWDIIYTPRKPVKAVFLSNLQEAPLDFYTPYFYLNRKEEIDERLEQISTKWSQENVINFLIWNYNANVGKNAVCNVGDYLKDENKGLLETLVVCIGRKVLAKIFERLVKNVKVYRSGMPDLILWNVEKSISKFVEVKGENDRLSVKQKLWLKYLKSIGADIEVCHVHSIGSKRKLLKEQSKSEESTSTSFE